MRRAAYQTPERSKPRPAWWQWPNVLSLDVPIIAVAWQRLIGLTLETPLHAHDSLLLGLTVWLIYSADRLLDGLKGGGQTQRHRFYETHRRSILSLWFSLMLGTLWLALTSLGVTSLIWAGLLAVAMLGYFLSRHMGRPDRHLKEVQIAVLFALGVGLIPFLSGAPHLPLLLATSLLSLLIFLNCAYIALWEADYDLEPAPFASRHPRLAQQLPRLSRLLLGGCALAGGLIPPLRPLALALAASTLLLNLLHLERVAAHLGPEARRVLGDATLLTPLVVLLWLRG